MGSRACIIHLSAEQTLNVHHVCYSIRHCVKNVSMDVIVNLTAFKLQMFSAHLHSANILNAFFVEREFVGKSFKN